MEFIVVKDEKDLNDCYCLRREVFVEEQNVPADIEFDEKEDESVHFLVRDSKSSIGAGRFYDEGSTAIIGRIVINKKNRGKGVGYFLMENILNHAIKEGFDKALLGAQKQAIGFYEKLGFSVCSDMYFDAGIEHYKMELDLRNIDK